MDFRDRLKYRFHSFASSSNVLTSAVPSFGAFRLQLLPHTSSPLLSKGPKPLASHGCRRESLRRPFGAARGREGEWAHGKLRIGGFSHTSQPFPRPRDRCEAST